MSEYLMVRKTTKAGSDAPFVVAYKLPAFDATADEDALIASSTSACAYQLEMSNDMKKYAFVGNSIVYGPA